MVMSLEFNAIINTYSFLLLIVVFVHHLTSGEKGTLPYKLFSGLISLIMLMLIIDTAGRFDGNPGTFYVILNHAGNFLLYLLNPLPPLLWFLYAHLAVFKNNKKTKKIILPMSSFVLINTAMLVASLFKGYYYYIDSGNIYHRGNLYIIAVAIPALLLLATFIMAFLNRSWLPRRYFLSMIFFPVFPAAAIVAQTLVYGISLQPNSLVIALLLLFLSIQNDQIFTDHLTGLNNRKRLDVYFKKKVNSDEGRPISAIMIDVDNFKAINDIYGHKVGDIVLKAVAEILKDSLGGNHFAARYGGDEFCVILDGCDGHALGEIVNIIEKNVDAYNIKNCRTYKISLSMGYSVYDATKQKPDDFFNQIDDLMYQKKKNQKKS